MGKFEVGDIVAAKVLNINPKERRIGLSIKQSEVDEEHDMIADYLNEYKGPASSLGEVLRENLREKAANKDSADKVPEAASENEVAAQEGEDQGDREEASQQEQEGVSGEDVTEDDQGMESTPPDDGLAPPLVETVESADLAAAETVEAEVREKAL